MQVIIWWRFSVFRLKHECLNTGGSDYKLSHIVGQNIQYLRTANPWLLLIAKCETVPNLSLLISNSTMSSRVHFQHHYWRNNRANFGYPTHDSNRMFPFIWRKCWCYWGRRCVATYCFYWHRIGCIAHDLTLIPRNVNGSASTSKVKGSVWIRAYRCFVLYLLQFRRRPNMPIILVLCTRIRDDTINYCAAERPVKRSFFRLRWNLSKRTISISGAYRWANWKST